MPLKEYRQKRDFKKTPEPAAQVKTSGGGLIFVVQKHAASRLHYDFRLELDGVLKSWAVPKGPSLDPAVKSLAVEVEDHPVAYANFEGVIPEGEYGGGTVVVWDHGIWEAEEDPHRGLKKGHLRFQLRGEKLNGGWHLVRLREEGPRKNWLLIKQNDASARPGDEHETLDHKPKSVLTGRTLEQVAQAADRVWTRNGEEKRPGKKRRTASIDSRKSSITRAGSVNASEIPGAKRAKTIRGFQPQLATLVRQAPDGDEWLHEIKFDGYRLISHVDGQQVRLLTRRGNDWTAKFPALVEELGKLSLQTSILDGELVANDEHGAASFQRLQNALRDGRGGELIYYVFDAPLLNGYDLRSAPLVDRKEALAGILLSRHPANDGMIRYSDHIRGEGPQVLEQACQKGIEGIVCKRADSIYESRRTRTWLKVKCHGRQEFVVVGFTKPEGSRTGFGALLLGYHDPSGELHYAGRVGTGFNEKLLASLSKRLKGITARSSPFAEKLSSAERRGVTYVRPELVAEIRFTEWTEDGRLRHPSFEGLRADKPAEEVFLEKPSALPEDRPLKSTSTSSKSSSNDAAETESVVADVRLTNPGRVLFSADNITKRELAQYYEQIADWILPFVNDRPLTIVRCPDGQNGKCFYQKHWTETLPDDVEWASIQEKSTTEKYIVIRNLAGLVSLVQISALELHPWSSRVDRLESPDQIIFDLDPGPDVEWEQIVKSAREMREVLTEFELTTFVRTSGGKGLHVVAPLSRRNSWDEVTGFARNIATGMAQHAPDRYVANMRKALRTGKVFIDYLRNQRGATAVASYSTRNRPGAPVATPLDWDELQRVPSSDAFTLRNIRKRLDKLREDPWEKFQATRQSLTKAILKKGEAFAKSS